MVDINSLFFKSCLVTAESHAQRGGPKIDPTLLRLDRTDLPIPRKGFATMQINSFTVENLTAALTEAKVR